MHYTCIIQSPPFNFCFVLPEALFSSSVKVLPFPQNYPTPKTQRPAPSRSLHQFIPLFLKLSIDLKLKGLFELVAKFNQSKNILGFWRIDQERERSKTEDKRLNEIHRNLYTVAVDADVGCRRREKPWSRSTFCPKRPCFES